HLSLYDKYHKFMIVKRDWTYSPIDVDDYVWSYVESSENFAKEFLYMRDDKLIVVALVDILPEAISAIYCYYVHDYSEFSIGKLSILAQIKIA
ncbi:arginyltransferase, partial [Aliarcobacter butzleri]